MSAITHFIDDDSGFIKYMHLHPDAWFWSCGHDGSGVPNDVYTLHHGLCYSVKSRQNLTTHKRCKTVSVDEAALAEFAEPLRRLPGSKAKRCPKC